MFDPKKIGDPNDRAVGRLVGCGRILQDDGAGIHALMRSYQVWRCVIDYFPEPTNARQFARSFKDAVYLCQYVKGVAGREVRLTEDDYGAHLARVDKVSWLSKSLGGLWSGALSYPLICRSNSANTSRHPSGRSRMLTGNTWPNSSKRARTTTPTPSRMRKSG